MHLQIRHMCAKSMRTRYLSLLTILEGGLAADPRRETQLDRRRGSKIEAGCSWSALKFSFHLFYQRTVYFEGFFKLASLFLHAFERAYSCTTQKRLCQRAVVVAAQLPVDLILRKLVGWEQPVGAGQAGHGRPAQVILM